MIYQSKSLSGILYLLQKHCVNAPRDGEDRYFLQKQSAIDLRMSIG